MKQAVIWISLCLLFSQCVDLFEGEFTSSGSNRIVITGGITDIEMPTIRIYESVPFTQTGSTPQLVNDAHVWLEDEEGVRYEFEVGADVTEREYHFFAHANPNMNAVNYEELFWDIDTTSELFQSDYRYEPIDKSLVGKVGKTYTLNVELSDGTTYASTPQELKASPEITNAYGEYEKARVINELGNEAPSHVWNVYAQTATSEPDVFLTWRYKGTYEVETFPEDYCAQPSNDCNPGIAHPREVPPGCCKYCYVTEYGSQFPTASSRENPSGRIGLQVATIPVTYDKTFNYYQTDIYQLAISAEVHNYLESINQQINGQGTIFDPTPTTLQGNITNVNNPDDKALGMFYAAGVTTARVNLNRTGIRTIFTPGYFPNDCRLVKNSTAEKPEGYTSGKTNWCYNAYIGQWNSCDMCFDMAEFRWYRCPE